MQEKTRLTVCYLENSSFYIKILLLYHKIFLDETDNIFKIDQIIKKDYFFFNFFGLSNTTKYVYLVY